MISEFDDMVSDMMQMFGTIAYVRVVTGQVYDTQTRENILTTEDYRVKACFFDYLDKKSGVGTEPNTLIQSGDKQVLIQPPHKSQTGIPLPHIDPNKDLFKLDDKIYKIVTIKEYNTSLSREGCVLYEAYIRE